VRYEETQNIGRKIAASIRGGEIFALRGDLGSGKTAFVQGFASHFNIVKLNSPTFILLRQYTISNAPIHTLYHLDLYRLEGDILSQVSDLGVQDFWGKEGTVTFVEWAEKASTLFPSSTQWIEFSYIDEETRKITFL
jgi:tRNA threonylcarbamoyladenosine biosynthesis protein TsaE